MGQGRHYENGSDHWRLIEPFLAAREHGHSCFVQRRGERVRVPPDVVMLRGEFFQRNEDFDAMLAQFERDSVLYVLDYDDCYHTWAELPGLVASGKAAPLANVVHQTRRAHVVTTTTPVLAQEITYLTGRSDVAVVPNWINLAAWRHLAPPDPGRPIVAVIGGDSHREDWETTVPEIFRGIAAGHPRVQFRLTDHGQDWQIELKREWGERLELQPFVAMARYPRSIEGATVVLAPLADTTFNRCRTPIRHWEATAAGAAFVGSSVLYHQSVQDGETGYLADDVDSYVGLTLDLLGDPTRRMVLVSYAREMLRVHALTPEAAHARFGVYYHGWQARYGAREANDGTGAMSLLPEADSDQHPAIWTPGGGRGAGVPDRRHRAALARDRSEGRRVG